MKRTESFKALGIKEQEEAIYTGNESDATRRGDDNHPAQRRAGALGMPTYTDSGELEIGHETDDNEDVDSVDVDNVPFNGLEESLSKGHLQANDNPREPGLTSSIPPDDDAVHIDTTSEREPVACPSTRPDDTEIGRNVVVDVSAHYPTPISNSQQSTETGTCGGIGQVEDTGLALVQDDQTTTTPFFQDRLNKPTTTIAMTRPTRAEESMVVHSVSSYDGDVICELDPFPDGSNLLFNSMEVYCVCSCDEDPVFEQDPFPE